MGDNNNIGTKAGMKAGLNRATGPIISMGKNNYGQIGQSKSMGNQNPSL